MAGIAGGVDPVLGRGQALIGHDLRQLYPVPSGWRALCECTTEFRGITKQHALDRWHAHWDEERDNAGLP